MKDSDLMRKKTMSLEAGNAVGDIENILAKYYESIKWL